MAVSNPVSLLERLSRVDVMEDLRTNGDHPVRQAGRKSQDLTLVGNNANGTNRIQFIGHLGPSLDERREFSAGDIFQEKLCQLIFGKKVWLFGLDLGLPERRDGIPDPVRLGDQ